MGVPPHALRVLAVFVLVSWSLVGMVAGAPLDPDLLRGATSFATNGASGLSGATWTAAVDGEDVTAASWHSSAQGTASVTATIPGGAATVRSVRVRFLNLYQSDKSDRPTQRVRVTCGGDTGTVLYEAFPGDTWSGLAGGVFDSGRVDVTAPASCSAVALVFFQLNVTTTGACSLAGSNPCLYALSAWGNSAADAGPSQPIGSPGPLVFTALSFSRVEVGALDTSTNVLASLVVEVHSADVGETGPWCNLGLVMAERADGALGPYQPVAGVVGPIAYGETVTRGPLTLPDGAGTYYLSCESTYNGVDRAEATIYVGLRVGPSQTPVPFASPIPGDVVDGAELCGAVDPACAVRNVGREVRGLPERIASAIGAVFSAGGEAAGEAATSAVSQLRGLALSKQPFNFIARASTGMGAQIGALAAEVSGTTTCPGLVIEMPDLPDTTYTDWTGSHTVAHPWPSPRPSWAILRCADFEPIVASTWYQAVRAAMDPALFLFYAYAKLRQLTPRPQVAG